VKGIQGLYYWKNQISIARSLKKKMKMEYIDIDQTRPLWREFIYNGFHEANLHLDGIAEIHPNGLLQLTNTSNQQVGYAFYPLPLKFNTTSSSSLTQSLSFSTNFVFAIVPQMPTLGGHGLAFTITPSWEFTHALAKSVSRTLQCLK
jgi:hypothetical protein